jgi:hypothetical protein
MSSIDWLTVNQGKVYKQLKNWMLRPGLAFIYLYGPHGVGKTFIGWLLDKEGITKYFVDLNSCRENTLMYIPVFADNVGADKVEFRRAMRLLEVLGIKKAILVGLYPIEEDTPKIQLTLNTDDLNQAQGKLVSNGFNLGTKHNLLRNLWDLFAL